MDNFSHPVGTDHSGVMVDRPLPLELRGHPFTIAGGALVGLSKSRMGASGLIRPTHGARIDTRPETVHELAAATAVALPRDIAFSHYTAAQLHGLPLPPGLSDRPLHVMRPSYRNLVRRKGFRGHRGLEQRTVADVKGVAATSMADTWVDLSALLQLDDLVVLGDAVVRRLDSTDPLIEALGARYHEGPAVARQALGFIRVGADSAMETRARLVFGRRGLPEPELNGDVADRHGEWIARADFVWRLQRVIAEFQGASHFEGFEAGDSDISRRLLAQDNGWKYIEITKRDIYHDARRAQMLQRLHRYLGC